jgi:hypothetical protein
MDDCEDLISQLHQGHTYGPVAMNESHAMSRILLTPVNYLPTIHFPIH